MAILKVDSFLTQIIQNKANHDAGIYNVIPFVDAPLLNRYIPGILRKKIYLISAKTGVGKSKFMRGVFFRAISQFKKDHPNIPVNVTFFSLEEDEDQFFATYIIQELAKKFPGTKHSFKSLLSLGKANTISSAHIEYINMKTDYFNDLVKDFDFQTMTDIDEIYDYLLEKIKARGTFNEEGKFVLNNPNEFNIFFIDHLKFLTGRAGENSEKLTMNDWSAHKAIDLTKNFGYTGVHIQQQSLGASKSKRPFDLEPKYETLGEHKNSIQDATFFIGLFQPSMFEINKYLGYDLTKIGSNFRSAVISKNRLDKVITRVPYILFPEKEIWMELAKPKTVDFLSQMANYGVVDYEENVQNDWPNIDGHMDNVYEDPSAPVLTVPEPEGQMEIDWGTSPEGDVPF